MSLVWTSVMSGQEPGSEAGRGWAWTASAHRSPLGGEAPPASQPSTPLDYALQEAGELPVLGGPWSVPGLGSGSGSIISLILSAPPPGKRAPKAAGREFSMNIW